jgi:hypothetical protein
MSEEPNSTPYPTNDDTPAQLIMQDASISPSEPQQQLMEVHHHPDLHELSIFSIYMNGSRTSVFNAEEDLKTAGADLIDFLKKEYHFEKE